MNSISKFILDNLHTYGVQPKVAEYLNMFILLAGTLLLIVIIDVVIKRIILGFFYKFSRKTKTRFDDILITNKLPRYVAHILPLLIASEFVPAIFRDFNYVKNSLELVLEIVGVLLTVLVIRSILRSVKDYLKTLARFKDKPLDSYVQVVMIFTWFLAIVTVFALISGQSIWKFFTALGAASAVILLIFKDTILGFVASIQVSVNDMVRIGDWITFEKYGADGDVIEISLATVKVQNFDKTITTIPTYALISDSFKNWRGMANSGGRRIKRALFIKLNSVEYLTANTLEDLKSITLISNYLTTRQAKIDKYNTAKNVNKTLLLNGRNLTNLGVFRKYIETYVQQHSAINKEMTIMVRQLQPTAQGIPLEIYAFSSDKRWQNYEYIIADIFDHLIAAVPYFKLELFELPNNSNFNAEKL